MECAKQLDEKSCQHFDLSLLWIMEGREIPKDVAEKMQKLLKPSVEDSIGEYDENLPTSK
jgi:hypothetical protein